MNELMTITIPLWFVILVSIWGILEIMKMLLHFAICYAGWKTKRLKGQFAPIRELFFGRKK